MKPILTVNAGGKANLYLDRQELIKKLSKANNKNTLQYMQVKKQQLRCSHQNVIKKKELKFEVWSIDMI